MCAASAMLDIPEFRARISRVTVAQYHQLPDYNANGRRTELLRGIVIEKKHRSPLHSGIASALYDLIRPQMPPDFWLRKEEPLTLSDSEPEPDLSLVHGSRADFATRHPATAALIIEIAVTSATEDRSLASLYAEAGVEEYWIVLAVERQVEIYRHPESGSYRDRTTVVGDAILDCGSVPAIRVNLDELFH